MLQRVPSNVLLFIEEAVEHCQDQVKARLMLPHWNDDRLEIPQPPKDLAGLILKLAYKQSIIEEAIRQQRLKDTVQRKRELQDKLSFLENQIEILEDVPAQQPLNIDNKGMTDEDRLAFIRKMEKHRKERDSVRQAKILKMQAKIAQMDEEEQREKDKAQSQTHEAMMKQLKQTEKELKRREKERQLYKSQSEQAYRAVVKSKPLYVQIEERYEEQVALPKLNEKKQKLAELRRHFAPIRQEDLLEHAKQYDEAKQAALETTQVKFLQANLHGHVPISTRHYYKGKYAEIADQEDKEFKESLRMHEIERRRLTEKRKKYGGLVAEIFKPDTDSKLISDVKRRGETIRNRRLASFSSPKSSTMQTQKGYDVKDVDFRSSLDNGRKFKPNPMIPKPKEKKSPVHIDFLASQRRRRDKMFLEEEPKNLDKLSWSQARLPETAEGQQDFISKADKQIERAKRQDLILSSVNPASIKSIQAQEEVDNVIVDSLKAKLAVLNSITH